jgi:hypothetical protein
MIYVLLFGSMEQSHSEDGRDLRHSISLLVPAAVTVLFVVAVLVPPRTSPVLEWATYVPNYMSEKSQIEHELITRGGKHLIIVHYDPDHNPHREYVYNRADFEMAPVLWARSLGATKDRELVRRYPGRQVWLYGADKQDIRPFTDAQPQTVDGASGK